MQPVPEDAEAAEHPAEDDAAERRKQIGKVVLETARHSVQDCASASVLAVRSLR